MGQAEVDAAYREPVDFDHPPLLFMLEDRLKGILGAPLMYEPFIRKQGLLKGHEMVLDFGCGGGVSTRTIAEHLDRGGKVTGIDVSSRMLSRARKRLSGHENTELLLGDVRELDLGDRHYDIIVAIHVIHEISSNERASTMSRLADLLSPDGQFWLLEFTREPHGISPEGIRSLMTRAGLEEVSSERTRSQLRGIFKKRETTA
jgi:ubiquinone/menaquinone biosynthesis C-methylase UbiE